VTSRDGYTLVEMLTALLILSLALGGLYESGFVIRGMTDAAARNRRGAASAREAELALDRLLRRRGPFAASDGDGFHGDAVEFHFPCESGSCGARLTPGPEAANLEVIDIGRRKEIVLAGQPSVQFRYVGSAGVADAWAPAKDDAGLLTAVAIVRARDGLPLAQSRLWRQMSPSCQWDAISRVCREAPAP
jgi:prepilin-type N-terminal cleavage/methylation domain-containing protein